MKFHIGAMSVGDILDRGLKLLLARLGTFYAINLIVLLPLLILQLAVPGLQGVEAGSAPGAATAAVGGLLLLLLAFILQPIATAAILHVIAQEFIDQSVTLGQAFGFAFRRFWRILGTSILFGLVVGIGCLLCLVPGIIFLFWYIFSAQVVVVEGLAGQAALNRSKELGTGYRWRVAGLVLLFLLIGMILGGAAGLLQLALPPNEMVRTATGTTPVVNYRNYAIDILVSALVNILVQAYEAVCLTLLYFDLRNRKEGFDLELAAKAQANVIS